MPKLSILKNPPLYETFKTYPVSVTDREGLE